MWTKFLSSSLELNRQVLKVLKEILKEEGNLLLIDPDLL